MAEQGGMTGVSESRVCEILNSLFRLRQADAGVVFAIAFDGGNLLLRVLGHQLHVGREIGRRQRGEFNALMLEQSVESALQLVHLALQPPQVDFRAGGKRRAAGKDDYNGGDGSKVLEF